MRIAITAGGTGGHIMPALTVAEALRHRVPEGLHLAFLGPDDRGERDLIAGSGMTFHRIAAAAMRGRGMLTRVRGVLRLAGGTWTALRLLRRLDIDVVFSTGGYGSFPACVAARILRKPVIVYLPDVTPGWAVRAESWLATRMATSTEAALEHLPRKKTRVTGYPIRVAFAESLDEARQALAISPGERVLLVAGASQGSQALNSAVFAHLETLLRQVTLFHITGANDIARAESLRDDLPAELQARYQPAAYRDDLPRVMIAADLAVMRSGASTLGELPAAGLPALLVPGTFAGGHQYDNARWLAEAGLARIVDEADLPTLADTITALLADPVTLAEMRSAALAAARPDAADAIAALIEEAGR